VGAVTTDERLGRIEEKIDHIKGALPPMARDVEGLKEWRWYTTGAIAMLGAIVLGCLIPLASGAGHAVPRIVAAVAQWLGY
jgi:hypothetical protein